MKNARTPVVVIGLLAAGWWLGSMFKGLGPGGPGTSTKTGTGDGVAVESRDPNAKRTAIEQQKDEAAASRAAPDVTGEGTSPTATGTGGAPALVTIVIDGPDYAVGQGDAALERATLDDVVARAQATTGDDQGVHVRIRRRKNAQAGARADLLTRLLDAGLKRESIQEMSGFID